MEILAIYLFLINALGFGIMYADKRRAKKNLWRIPERTLLTVALIGVVIAFLLAALLTLHLLDQRDDRSVSRETFRSITVSDVSRETSF